MEKKLEQNELFQSSHLMILNCYTIFSAILLGESLLLGWEKWALVLIVCAVVASWTLHIRQRLDDTARIWIYSTLMMVTFFFYGIHQTSTFDIAAVMLAVIMIYTMTGIKALITLCQITFYITFAFDIITMVSAGQVMDSLDVTRSMLHIALVTMGGWIARTIIEKWGKVLMKSAEEIFMLKEATTRLNDFLANISHEIRTPVNAVIGLTGVCLEKEKDEEIKTDLQSISAAGKRVGEQISDILDYSEIDMNRLAVNTEDYMLSSILNDLVAELSPYRNPEIELIIDVDAGLPAVMHTDTFKLKKILWHLIMNGLKYTKSGGVYVHITHVHHEYGINLCVEVRDTGIGMSEHEIDHIFDQFYQADSGRTRSTSGLGLGLAIVNGFVRSLGGFLAIESKPGEGSTVRISIPMEVVDEENCMSLESPEKFVLGAYLHFEKFEDPHVRDFYNRMVRNIVMGLRVQMHRVDNLEGLKKLVDGVYFTHLFVGKEEYESDIEYMEELAKSKVVAIIADDEFELPPGSNAIIMRKPFFCFPVIAVLNTKVGDIRKAEEKLYCNGARALVVDDEPMNLTVAKGIFKQYGMVVETAPGGKEAIEMCRENEYDLIFMDHMMPEMDGIETMKRIRSEVGRSKLHGDVPIVALTANAVSTAKEMFIKEGFDGFVSKPIELNELERVLRKVLPKTLISTRIDGQEETSENAEVKVEKEAPSTDPFVIIEAFGVDTRKGLSYSQNDRDFYKTLMLQYGDESAEKLRDIDRFLAEDDLKNYAIVLHAIKSTSKMIGALGLSEKAKELELAAKAGDGALVREKNDETVKEYEILATKILELFGEKRDESETGHGAGDADEEDGDILEFGADNEDDEVLEFGAEEKSETGHDEIMEFGPEEDE